MLPCGKPPFALMIMDAGYRATVRRTGRAEFRADHAIGTRSQQDRRQIKAGRATSEAGLMTRQAHRFRLTDEPTACSKAATKDARLKQYGERRMKLYDSIGPNPRIVRMFMAEKGI